MSCVTFSRKASGKCGFAESMPRERITALKMDETAVEMTDGKERANDIVERAETPPQMYPILASINKERTDLPLIFCSFSLPASMCSTPISVISSR